MTPAPRKPAPTRTPAELRNMFGANLRQLASSAVSISALCRDLGINRTQFNRYLSGESFPRPDVLAKICHFFGMDARILLEPVDEISQRSDDPFSHPETAEFLGPSSARISEDDLPSGLYRFSRASFMNEKEFVIGVVQVYRKDSHVFLRGYEAREAMRQQGLKGTAKEREFRGFLKPQEGGFAMLVSRRNALTFSFSFLSRVPSFQNNFWVGYTARTAPETVTASRAARVVLERLDKGFAQALAAARGAGLVQADELPAFHASHLRVGTPFS